MELNITVPTSLSDIKLRDYQKFIKIANDNQDDLFLRQKMVQIFCNIPLLAVSKMRRKDFTIISNALIEILQEKPSLKRIVELNGQKYGFIPNLDDDMSFGEFVDLDDYMKDWKDFHKAMAVLYRPIKTQRKENYTIIDYDTEKVSSSVMLDMPMDVVMGSVVFFWTLSALLLKITPKYLAQVLRKNPGVQEVLEKNGVGISTYTNSLEEACLNLERLLPYTLARH